MNKLKKLFAHTRWVYMPALLLMLACQSPQRTDAETTQTTPSDTTTKAAGDSPSLKLQNHSVEFLSREERFDPEYDATINTIVLNEAYIETISDPEKAALGYIATFIGNECSWDGKATSDRSNLKCKILTALDLGYQCSDTHLGFLQQWFRDDSTALEKLAGCPTIPDGATIQETFDKITLTVEDNEIVVAYTVTGINTRESKSWTRDVEDHFTLHENALEWVKTEKSEPVLADFELYESGS